MVNPPAVSWLASGVAIPVPDPPIIKELLP